MTDNYQNIFLQKLSTKNKGQKKRNFGPKTQFCGQLRRGQC